MPFNYEKAKEIHGDKYDYSEVQYVNVDTKVIIICPIHGRIEQTPYHHINRGCGCKKCKGNKISLSKRLLKNEFIDKANLIHKDKYDYSIVEYINAHKPVRIICPIHGEFEQRPNNHLYDFNGCPNCGHNTSRTGDKWLQSLGIDKNKHEKIININGVKFKVDAFDEETNTIYEYFGNFWHGNPKYFKSDDINPRNKRTFGELYQKTLNRIETFEKNGYKLIYEWGN